MNELFKKIKNDSVLFWCYLVSIFLLIITIIVAILTFSHLPPVLPLYNKMPWGYQRLGKTIEVFIPSLILFFCLLINSFFSAKFISNPLISRLIAVTTFVVALLACIFIIKTISLIY